MEVKIECRECDECGRTIEELDRALVGEDGIVLCKKCVIDWMSGAFVDAIERIQSANLTVGAKMANKYIDESRIVYPRGRDF